MISGQESEEKRSFGEALGWEFRGDRGGALGGVGGDLRALQVFENAAGFFRLGGTGIFRNYSGIDRIFCDVGAFSEGPGGQA